jgi:hypothetical protein
VNEENLDPIPSDKGYFSTPHFRLFIDLLDSQPGYSVSLDRQKMIQNAVEAVKPINTVFDGVATRFTTSTMLYMRPIQRLRKHIRLLGGTFTS